MSLTSEMLFRPHGHFSVRVEGQILLTEVTGPWNLELVEYWATQALGLAQGFRKDFPYVAVTIIHDSMLCPLDALERVAQGVAYARQNLACVGHCIVVAPDVDGREIVRNAYQRIGLGLFFADLEQALHWASQCLSKFRSDGDQTSDRVCKEVCGSEAAD